MPDQIQNPNHFDNPSDASPGTPANASPSNGAADQSASSVLTASAFSGTDNYSHIASQWQMTATLGEYTSPVFDSGEDIENLISITVPSPLIPNTTYYWRVKHKNSDGNWSDYSSETSFLYRYR